MVCNCNIILDKYKKVVYDSRVEDADIDNIWINQSLVKMILIYSVHIWNI